MPSGTDTEKTFADLLRLSQSTQSPSSPAGPPEGWASRIPAIPELLLRTSLYADMEVAPWDRANLELLRRSSYRFDGYCTACEKESIFCGGRDPSGQPAANDFGYTYDWMFQPGYFFAEAFCQRCAGVYVSYFVLDNKHLSKIGQFPSLEDIAASENGRYRQLMDKGDFADLRRATGLFSHGIGIGSFVYLRRSFERLIDRHRTAVEANGEQIADWSGMRMAERIKALENVLPPAIVKHRSAYQILSAGIHELDEDTCRKYFPVVRAAIIQILEQDLQKRQAERAEADLEKELESIRAEIAGAGKTIED